MGKGFPRLVQMHEKYGKNGLVILTVTVDDPKDAAARAAVEKFLAKKSYPFRTMNLDGDQEKLPTLDFGGGVPGVFVFDRDNRYVKKLPLYDRDRKETVEEFDYDLIEKAVAGALQKK